MLKNTGGNDNVRLVRVLPCRIRHGMSLAKSRNEAIGTACDLMDRKMNVQEIGPLPGMRDPGDFIDSVEIRKLHAMRIPPDSAH
jgi:hypothetical protein